MNNSRFNDGSRRALRVFAQARPGALAMPAHRRVQAFTAPEVWDRWLETLAALRPSSAQADENVIQIFGEIGADYWAGTEITERTISAQLAQFGGAPVTVQINSGGGDMFAGIAIYNVLREYPGEITIKVMGMAASAASIITMAGDRVEIGAASFLMIHNAWILAAGNRNDLRDLADWLEPFDMALCSVYAQRTGIEFGEIAKMMDAETYLSGAQAVDQGFADGLLAADKVKEDKPAMTAAREVNALRAIEHSLVAGGLTRTQARAQINKIKSMPGAAQHGKQDAADPETAAAFAALMQTLKS